MKKKVVIISLSLFISSQAMAFKLGDALKNSGGSVLKAATLSEKDVINDSRSAIKFMDSKQESEPAAPKYQQRLDSLVAKIKVPEIKNVKFNFKVYKSEPDNLNAFATPDGSIRFHTALMDKMTDNQVTAVLGHEIGHVVEKHSFNQMRKSLLATAAVRGAASSSKLSSEAYNAGMGNLAEGFLGASFSRGDEKSADKYALKLLQEADLPMNSMQGAIKVLQTAYGDGGGMMSSHPSNPNRLKALAKAEKKMSN
jgi:putative metalloprotease